MLVELRLERGKQCKGVIRSIRTGGRSRKKRQELSGGLEGTGNAVETAGFDSEVREQMRAGLERVAGGYKPLLVRFEF